MTRITGKTPVNSTVTKMSSGKPISTAAKLVVNINPGTTSPMQKQAWNRFWQKLMMEVKKETDK
jgi:hypothetical protein